MNMDQLTQYLVPAAIVLFLVWRMVKFRLARKALPDLIKRGAQVIDVRSKSEYASAHYPGSRNMPLDNFAALAKQLDKNTPVVLCCASGTRSGMAAGILRSQGFKEVVNAGPWQNLNV